jgi:pimeloyl-ACP methyl ester carboxylesterase/class 3 adenylate cyclase
MAEQSRHRLMAILAADAAGYSRLMANDDLATLAALDAARETFRAGVIAAQGRIVDMAGDSVLAAFPSAQGAVVAALRVQADLQATATPLSFRIGVHLGDVIEKSDGTIYGDGVNVAARLQALAAPGCVVVSQAVLDAVGARLSVPTSDLGAQIVKNIPQPVHAHALGTGAATPPAARSQHVRYLPATDGLRLAWAEVGSGSTLVKAANWLTHLEYEWNSPVWKHWIRFFSQHWRFVRYDERGCGMSDWREDGLTLDQWADDLQSVIDAAQPAEPITLIGISQGAATCIRYATRHPDRVERLILYGGFAHGASLRKGILSVDPVFRALVELANFAWASDNWTFRQMFTSRFVPGGSDEQLKWFNDLCLKSTTGQIAARLVQARDAVDVTGLLHEVRTPTLVLHARNDEVVPVEEGRILASEIPGAEFVELDSRNHVLLEAEPAWNNFCDAVLGFLPLSRSRSL